MDTLQQLTDTQGRFSILIGIFPDPPGVSALTPASTEANEHGQRDVSKMAKAAAHPLGITDPPLWEQQEEQRSLSHTQWLDGWGWGWVGCLGTGLRMCMRVYVYVCVYVCVLVYALLIFVRLPILFTLTFTLIHLQPPSPTFTHHLTTHHHQPQGSDAG